MMGGGGMLVVVMMVCILADLNQHRKQYTS